MAPKRKRPAPSGRPRNKAEVERSILPATKDLPATAREESCCACLLGIEADAQVGLVDGCTHFFHFDCIERWAKTENTCPQCKTRFSWIASYSPEGRRTCLQRVKKRDQEADEDDDDEELQFCEVCHEIGDEHKLLLCDGMHGTCNAAYHCSCVGLDVIPRGSWFCPDCVDRGFDVDAHGNRGKRVAREQAVAGEPPTAADAAAATPAPEAAEGGSSSSSSPPAPGAAQAISTPPPKAASAPANAAPMPPQAPAATPPPPAGRSRRVGAVPPQLRISALACVTPPVEVPSFRAAEAGDEGTAAMGLFASFAARRRSRGGGRGLAPAGVGGGASTPEAVGSGFISLSPAYEEDFIGKTSL